jgi:hypothetical protein
MPYKRMRIKKIKMNFMLKIYVYESKRNHNNQVVKICKNVSEKEEQKMISLVCVCVPEK